jgi:hypothetical protein
VAKVERFNRTLLDEWAFALEVLGEHHTDLAVPDRGVEASSCAVRDMRAERHHSRTSLVGPHFFAARGHTAAHRVSKQRAHQPQASEASRLRSVQDARGREAGSEDVIENQSASTAWERRSV